MILRCCEIQACIAVPASSPREDVRRIMFALDRFCLVNLYNGRVRKHVRCSGRCMFDDTRNGGNESIRGVVVSVGTVIISRNERV